MEAAGEGLLALVTGAVCLQGQAPRPWLFCGLFCPGEAAVVAGTWEAKASWGPALELCPASQHLSATFHLGDCEHTRTLWVPGPHPKWASY